MLWPLIYDANRSTIGVNPNVIRIGQKLAIPELASFTVNPAGAGAPPRPDLLIISPFR